MQHSIRQATKADLDPALDLLKKCDLPPEGVIDQFPDAYAVVEIDGAIVALAGIERYGDHGLIRSVAVDPDFRGMELGQQVVRERLAWATESGITEIYLITTDAARFFGRLGFLRIAREKTPEPVRQSPEFSKICPESAEIMKIVLTN